MKAVRAALVMIALTMTACTRTPAPVTPSATTDPSPSVVPSTSTVTPGPQATTTPAASIAPLPSASPSFPPSVTFWPDGAGGVLAGRVGETLRLLVGTSPDRPPRISVSPATAARASVSGSDWNLYFANLELLEPGGILVTAELGEARAHALVASVAPDTVSNSLPLPAGFPVSVPERPTEARVIIDATGWSAFVTDLGLDVASAEQPPTDLSQTSLVAIVAPYQPRVAAPVVTHLVREPATTVHVVVPELEIRGSGPSQPGGIFLFAIPKVGPKALAELHTLASVKR
ncbi:hypothetical protein D3C72_470760 [compost metagenome]